MQTVAGFMHKKFKIGCHLKPPLRVDYECFLITTVPVGSILWPKFEPAPLPPYTCGTKKKANLWRVGCKKNSVVECNSPGKIWPVCRYPNRQYPLIILILQISCKIFAAAEIILYYNFKWLKKLMLKWQELFKEVQAELCNLFHNGSGVQRKVNRFISFIGLIRSISYQEACGRFIRSIGSLNK